MFKKRKGKPKWPKNVDYFDLTEVERAIYDYDRMKKIRFRTYLMSIASMIISIIALLSRYL